MVWKSEADAFAEQVERVELSAAAGLAALDRLAEIATAAGRVQAVARSEVVGRVVFAGRIESAAAEAEVLPVTAASAAVGLEAHADGLGLESLAVGPERKVAEMGR
jgi:hypothetical protein